MADSKVFLWTGKGWYKAFFTNKGDGIKSGNRINYGVIPHLNYVKNSYLFDKMCYKISSTITVKSGQLGGNADTFMPIFSADTLDFLVTDIFLEEGIIHFFW